MFVLDFVSFLFFPREGRVFVVFVFYFGLAICQECYGQYDTS